MIDLVALRSLLALDTHGTVGAAAAATGYTPSAVSQQIKRLERDLDLVLLERTGRRVVLTDPGRRLVEHGAGMLRDLEDAVSALRAGTGRPRGTVRLAAFSTAVRGLAAPVMAALAAEHPEVRCDLVERDPAEALALVVAGQADLAIVHNWVGVPLHRPDHLRGRTIGADRADLLVHRDHPVAGRDGVTPADLLDEPWTSTPPGTICHAWFGQMFAGHPRLPTIRFVVLEFESQIALVAAGLAVALVPRLGRGALPETVVAVPVTEPVPTREITLAWRESADANPTVRLLADRLGRALA